MGFAKFQKKKTLDKANDHHDQCMMLLSMHTWKKRKKQHKRIFSPKKLAPTTRKSVNIKIRDKTAQLPESRLELAAPAVLSLRVTS